MKMTFEEFRAKFYQENRLPPPEMVEKVKREQGVDLNEMTEKRITAAYDEYLNDTQDKDA